MDKEINDKYIIDEVISRDAQHVVYRGIQRMTEGIERPVALKLLSGWNVEAEQEKDYLVSEISTMVELGNTPYIVTIHDFGFDQEHGPWVVMELARNAMDARIEDGPADPNLVRQVASQMLQAAFYKILMA